MAEIFDFTEFMKKASARDEMREAVANEMDKVMGELAPRIWCVMQEQMAKNPKDDAYLNAVVNASMFALLSWTAAVTPAGEKNDAILRDKLASNLDHALEHARDQGAHMSHMALNKGRLQLSEDALKGLGHLLQVNSHAITLVAEALSKNKP